MAKDLAGNTVVSDFGQQFGAILFSIGLPLIPKELRRFWIQWSCLALGSGPPNLKNLAMLIPKALAHLIPNAAPAVSLRSRT